MWVVCSCRALRQISLLANNQSLTDTSSEQVESSISFLVCWKNKIQRKHAYPNFSHARERVLRRVCQTNKAYVFQPLLFAAYSTPSGNRLSCVFSFLKLVLTFKQSCMWVFHQHVLLVLRGSQWSLAVPEINLALKWGHPVCSFSLLQSFRVIDLY